MNYFPTTIIDNFLPDPKWVRDFALSDKIEWHTDEKGMWPGERSQMLFEVDNNLFQFIMQRYFTHFYSPDDLDKVSSLIGEKVRKLPQVIVDGKRIGGYYDLMEFLMNMKLINYKGVKNDID